MKTLAPTKGFAVTLAALTLVSPLAIHLFLPVVPEIKSAFAISDALAELTFSITLATMAVATLVYGGLSDRFGRRPVLLSGLALFLAGSALSAVAGSVAVLVLGRLIQAVGAGSGVTLTRAIARDAYGPDKLVQAIAYLTMAYTLGPMVAPIIGGFLVDHLGWRSVFWFAVLAGGVISAVAAAVLHETRRAPVGGARGAGILLDYGTLFANRRFTGFVLQSGFMSGTFFTTVAAAPFLMQGLGRSGTEFGLYFMLYPAGYCIANYIASRMAGRVSIERMVMLGSVLNFMAVIVQAVLILGGALSPLTIFGPGFFITFAQGLSLPNAQAGAMQTQPALAGTAAGIGVFCQTLGSAVFVQLYGTFADGTPLPMIVIAVVAASLSLVSGAVPFFWPLAQRP
jgi:MFS transporter, DHA1 family, multidrug resistance protein